MLKTKITEATDKFFVFMCLFVLATISTVRIFRANKRISEIKRKILGRNRTEATEKVAVNRRGFARRRLLRC